MKIYKPILTDINKIYNIINYWAKKNLLLNRPKENIARHIKDFFCVKENNEIIAVAALQIYTEKLTEIKSLAVKKKYHKRGIASFLIKELIAEAEKIKSKKIFALTYRPDLFLRLGFKKIDKSILPQKIWQDCLICNRFPICDEQAVIKGI